jgi:plastocyanin domain-containing protein
MDTQTSPSPAALRSQNHKARRNWRRFLALIVVVAAPTAVFACNKKADASASGTAAPAAPTDGPQRVLVTEDGFQPATVMLKKGEKLIFTRKTDETCAKAVVFPDLHIEKQLPLNTDVTIELPQTAVGEVSFQCGMGMYKSKVVVR